MSDALVKAAPGGPMTTSELLEMMEMVARGLSPREIADHLERTPTTIKARLKDARLLLQTFAPTATAAWLEAMNVAATKGDHRPAKDLLIAAKAIDPVGLQETGGPTVQVQIGIAIPGLPPPVVATPVLEGETD
jgi:hypothetical protein